jgi:lysophospholipase L1-like esterase
VLPQDNYPNQTISLLKQDHLFGQLKIIATTGWTTVDLKAGIERDHSLLTTYDFVSLLIGVNNQYQGMPIENYTPQFDELLKKAISFAGNDAKRMIVFSMPDWGVTPFANGRDRAAIAKEIDAYNAINKAIAQNYGVHYIDITPWSREAANDLSLLEPGGLHPSGKEYVRWAVKLEEIIKRVLRK